MEKILTVTEEGLKKLTDELEYLKTVKRKEVTEAIRVALSFGDLSENSEYDEAKTEQAKVEARILELEEMLKNIRIISDDEIHTDAAGIGAKVRVYNKSREMEIEYSIVSSIEANPLMRKISDQSPIGNALIGARVGDTVKAETPAGIIELEILEISRA